MMETSRYPRVAAGGRQVRAILTRLAVAESPARGVVVGSVLYALAIVLRLALGLEGFAFLTFFPVVGLSALVGGAAVGTFFAVVSLLTAWFFFIPASSSFAIESPADGFALLGFATVAAIEVVLVDQLSSALRRAEAAQQRAVDALDAQRTMFLEFQHRVANSLQSVSSLLAVERKRVQAGEADAGETLAEAARRLQAMARLHRRLYDPDTARRDFRAVVGEVCEELRVAMGAEAVEFDVDIPDCLSIGVERLLPLALVVAEAVTNSLKHAYRAGRGGTIRISLLALARHYELTVRDDGPGLPETVPAGQDSLGMMVMRSLAQRLGGRLEVLSDRGTVTRLTFPMGVRA